MNVYRINLFVSIFDHCAFIFVPTSPNNECVFLFPFRYAYWPLTFLPLTFDNFLSVRILSENLPEAILPFQFLPIQLFSSVLRSFPCFAISTYCVRSRHSLTSHSLSLSVASVGCTYNWGCESGSLSISVATFTVSHNRNNRPWWENE